MRAHIPARRRKVVVALFVTVMVLGGPGQRPALGQAEVSELNGSAYGVYVSLSLFGGAATQRGPAPVVVLPPGGGSESDRIPEFMATFGPAHLYAGHWPEEDPQPPPSGPLTASTEGETGPDAYVTSSATAVQVGPTPMIADEMRSTCTADGDGVSASTTIIGGVVETSFNPDTQLPVTSEDVPENPPPNTAIEGEITHVGDRFRIVFNEQIIDGDTIVVRAAHMYLLGDIAVGDMIVGQSVCGLSADVDGATAPPTTEPGAEPPPTSQLPEDMPEPAGSAAPLEREPDDGGVSPVLIGAVVVAGGLGLAAVIAFTRRRGRAGPET